MGRMIGLTFAAMGLVALAAPAQFISNSPPARPAEHENAAAVVYLFPEQMSLPAGTAAAVELHFRVAPGLHINSHTPHDAFLIPTTFSIPAGAAVKLISAVYPTGRDETLPADPKTKLNVYTGEFAIKTRLVAEAGNHLVRAKLHYQACDQMQCMPPKTATVAFDVIGK